MNGFGESLRGFFLTLSFIVRTTLTNVTGHWALAFFSLVGAGIIWIVIQDIEDPRVEGLVPLEGQSQGIPVEFVNLSPEFVVGDTTRVRVRVEARESDIPQLGPGDFRAVVDLQGIEPGFPRELPVTVESTDDRVRVLNVVPEAITVELTRVVEEEFPVEVNITGTLPAGFQETLARVIDPAFVTVSGRPDLVENVDRVEIDVNLSGQRASFETTGELVARNRNGDEQTVSLSSRRATVAFTIEQLFVEKVIPVRPRTTGTPAPGFLPTSIQVQPPFVTVSGPKEIVDGLEELVLDPIDLNGATSAITQSRSIEPPSNVALGQESVRVDVGIAPVVCGGDNEGAPCAGVSVYVAPEFRDVEEGLTLASGAYVARIVVAGPLPALQTLDPAQVTATVSLAGLTAGESRISPTVTVPEPFTIQSVDPITITLISTESSELP